jgi:predicted AAA+ superfamily ATPase
MFDRWYAEPLRKKLKRPFVHLMFGARQTGKSTVLNTLLPDNALRIDLSDPAERTRHLSDPGEFIKSEGGYRSSYLLSRTEKPRLINLILPSG